MAGVVFVICPALIGLVVGGAGDATILMVDKIPTLPTLAAVVVAGGMAAMVAANQWRQSTIQRREKGGGGTDYVGLPGTFFWGGFTAMGIVLLVLFMIRRSLKLWRSASGRTDRPLEGYPTDPLVVEENVL